MTYIQPLLPSFLFLFLLLGIRNFRKYRSISVLFFAFIAIFLSTPAASWLLVRPFEGRYSIHPPSPAPAQAIVVLSSTVFPPFPPLPTAILGADTFERCQYAAWLQQNWGPQHGLLPVLATGGGSRGGIPYAQTMSEALAHQGVPAALIWSEEQSTSTFENAALSAPVLRRHQVRSIVLVTEAYHMPRAEACFRKQGFQVIAAPCGFRTASHVGYEFYIPSWEAISWDEDSLHEGLGLAWYKVRGRI